MTLVIDAIEVRLLELPLVEPFIASHGTTSLRTLTVVKVSSGKQSGWGECSALPAATYSNESAGGAFDLLVERLAPELVGTRVDRPTTKVPQTPPEDPMAWSAVEMAILDLRLKAKHRSLAEHLGVKRTSVPAGVSLGLGDAETTAQKVANFVEAGFSRVKLKVQPGHDALLVEKVRARSPNVGLQIDANGAYGSDHIEHLSELAQRFGVEAIEQPFPPQNTAAASKLVGLVAPLGIHVVADESVAGVDDVRRLSQQSALTAVSIKPGRLGGIRAAVTVHDLCQELRLAGTAGGMLESGLGRHALAAVSALPHFLLTGDVSPAKRWVATDPWPDLEMMDGTIAVPTTRGVAPPPNIDVLDHVTSRSELVS